MTSDQYAYTKELVLALLPQAFDYRATPKRDEDESHRGGGDPALGGNHLAHLADIRQRLNSMAGTYQRFLYWHAHGEPSYLGEAALDRLVASLNGTA